LLFLPLHYALLLSPAGIVVTLSIREYKDE
jgi:hypothetical protein